MKASTDAVSLCRSNRLVRDGPVRCVIHPCCAMSPTVRLPGSEAIRRENRATHRVLYTTIDWCVVTPGSESIFYEMSFS
jgi:hypothetical protein